MKYRLIILFIFYVSVANTQPVSAIYSFFEFNLGKKRDTLSIEQIKKEEIKFYSNSTYGSIKYNKNKILYSGADNHNCRVKLYIMKYFSVLQN